MPSAPGCGKKCCWRSGPIRPGRVRPRRVRPRASGGAGRHGDSYALGATVRGRAPLPLHCHPAGVHEVHECRDLSSPTRCRPQGTDGRSRQGPLRGRLRDDTDREAAPGDTRRFRTRPMHCVPRPLAAHLDHGGLEGGAARGRGHREAQLARRVEHQHRPLGVLPEAREWSRAENETPPQAAEATAGVSVGGGRSSPKRLASASEGIGPQAPKSRMPASPWRRELHSEELRSCLHSESRAHPRRDSLPASESACRAPAGFGRAPLTSSPVYPFPGGLALRSTLPECCAPSGETARLCDLPTSRSHVHGRSSI
jgi:hypothetical protein